MTLVTGEAQALAVLRHMIRSGEAQRIREAAEVSQTEVARSIGSTPSAVSHWEAKRRTPRGAVALAYLELLMALAETAQS